MKIALTFILAIITLVQADRQPATLEGIARNLKSGEPLADVRVTVTPDPPTAGNPAAKSGTTDAEGKFSISGLVPGRYTVNATRTLFYRPKRNTGAIMVAVTANQRLRDVQILLMPTAVIAGRIIDQNRAPLRSVRIEALRSEYRDGVRTWVNAGGSATDDRGEYRIFNLQPGTYYIRATQGNIAVAGSPLYYPGVPDSQDASPIQIEPGNESGAIDITMRQISEYSVQFKLGGVPSGSTVNVSIQRRYSKIVENVLIRPETLPGDSYRIPRLPAGAYDLFVQVSTPPQVQPRAMTHAGRIPVNIGRSDEDLGTVSIQPTVPISGRIVASEPLPSVIDFKRLTLTLHALDLPSLVNATVRGSATPSGFNANGTFTLNNIANGLYEIQLSGLPSNTYLVSAKAGTREVLDTGYTVSGDQTPLELTIGGPGSVGIIEGSVINARGEPLPETTVVLVPAVERRRNPAAFRITSSDQTGSFALPFVLPGEYKVLAWEEIEPGAYMDPAFLKDFETRGEILRVERGSQHAVTVHAIP